ncbi:MAG: NfeD family protein [Quisquiliibacterium sp.]
MQEYWIWWGLAVLFGVLEIATGTFYLLVLAGGLAAGGVAAYLGTPFAGQLIAAALFSIGGWFWLRKLSARRVSGHPGANRDLLLDIGQVVQVDRWQSPRATEVVYRGAQWDAVLTEDDSPGEPGQYQIVRLQGNTLVLKRQV